MSRFVLSVSPSGVCSFVSRRSGRRLSGGAVVACSRAVLAGVRSRSALVRSAARRVRELRAPCCLWEYFSCARCPSASSCLSSLALVPVPPAPSAGDFSPPFPSPVAPSGSFAWFAGLPPVSGLSGPAASGSAVLLVSPGFRAAVAAGECPVSLALSSFSWPLRSAVLWSLGVVLCRPAGAAFVASPRVRPVAVACLWDCFSSLGFRVPAWGASRAGVARRVSSAWDFLARRGSGGLPAAFSSLRGSARGGAVVSALSSVSRCLRWLARRSGRRVFCPGALRPAVVFLASCLLSALFPLVPRG